MAARSAVKRRDRGRTKDEWSEWRGSAGAGRGGLWISVTLALLASLGIAAWLEHAYLLRGAADLWVVSDPVMHADAVAVFGGAPELRPFVAADLYRKNMVRKVLVSHAVEDPSVNIAAVPSSSAQDRAVLLKLGSAMGRPQWRLRDHCPDRTVLGTAGAVGAGTAVRIAVPSFESPRYHRSVVVEE